MSYMWGGCCTHSVVGLRRALSVFLFHHITDQSYHTLAQYTSKMMLQRNTVVLQVAGSSHQPSIPVTRWYRPVCIKRCVVEFDGTSTQHTIACGSSGSEMRSKHKHNS